MKNKAQSQKEIYPNSKPLFSIIPLVDEVKSKISQQNTINKVTNLQKSSNTESKIQQSPKENSDLSPPKKYKFNDQQKQNDIKTQEDTDSNSIPKEERKHILKKIIFSAKSSNCVQKPTINDNDQTVNSKKIETEEKIDKIQKYNSDFPSQKKHRNDDLQRNVKNDKKYSVIPNSISDSKINEKDSQNNSRKIVFLIKSSSNFPNDDLIKPDHQEPNKKESDIKNSNSDFPKKFNFGSSLGKENEKKAKISRKALQAAKSSNNLQGQNPAGLPLNISEEENEKAEKIKMSNSDFPTPKKLKSESLRKESNDETKNQQDSPSKNIRKSASTTKSTNTIQNENDAKLGQKSTELKKDKIKKFNSDFPSQKKVDFDDDLKNDQIKNKEIIRKDKENSNKIPRKVIESTKSTTILQKPNKSEVQSSQKTDESKTDKIKKFNSDFPTPKKLESEAKPTKEKDSINKIPRKPITSTKSSNILQIQGKHDQKPLTKNEDSKDDKIKKNNSDFPIQRKINIDDSNKGNETSIKDKENVNKIPRKPITSASSSNNLQNQNPILPKEEESKADKIKKINSDFPTQKKLESEPKNNKIPRKIIESTKSSNTIQSKPKNDTNPRVVSKSEEQKSDKIKKFNSDLPINKKIENDEKSDKTKTMPKQNAKTNSTTKEIAIEIEIERDPIKDQKSIQKSDQQKSQKTVKDFIPSSNSPNQSPSNASNQQNKNVKKQNSPKKQDLNINLADPNKNKQNSKNSNTYKMKNIQIEYKNDKNKQDQKPRENTNQQPQNNAPKSPVSVISVQQNQKQKLNIVMKPKDQSQPPSKESTNNQPKDVSQKQPPPKETPKNQPKESSLQPPPQNQQPKEPTANHPKETAASHPSQQQKDPEKPKTTNRHSRVKENRFLWKEPTTTTTTTTAPTTPPNSTATTATTTTVPNSTATPKSSSSNNEDDESQKQQKQPILQNENENQEKESILLNENSKLNEEMKKQIKYEIEKAQQNMAQSLTSSFNKQKAIYTLKMCIESQPVCIAIGDIEGDFEKLHQVVSFIRSNPTLHFVFIGDIIDDLSDACSSSSESWDCLSLLSEFFVSSVTFSLDNTDTPKSDTIISLPSSFCEISFREAKYGNIRNRVKFLAGNAECDNLLDFQKPCQIVPGEVTSYAFGQGKWKKTVTFEKMCLLYRYLKSCYGIIKLKKSPPENKKNSPDFIDTVYFRHSPSSFKINRFPKNMYFPNPDLKKSDVEKRNFFFVTGHARIFASISSQKHDNKEMFYVVDTTVLDAQNQYLKDVGGFGTNDRRLAVISFDKEIGFSVKAISLPCAFPKSTLKCKISDKYIQIKGI